MDIPEIVDEEKPRSKSGPRKAMPTEKSSDKAFAEAFYVKLGPTPAFPRG